MADGFSIDVSSFKRFALQMRVAETVVKKFIDAELSLAVSGVEQAVKKRASFSTRIPQTVRVRKFQRDAYIILAGGRGAPDAAPLNNRTVPGMFRHPVFGDRSNWVSQEAHPFMPIPALEAPGFLKAGKQAIDATFKTVIHG